MKRIFGAGSSVKPICRSLRFPADSGVLLLIFCAFMLMFSPGHLRADDRISSSAAHSVEAGNAALRIDYEAGAGIPRVFFETSGVPLWSPEAQKTSALFVRVDNRVTRLSDERAVSVYEADGALETTWRSGRISATLRTEVLNADNGIYTGRLQLSLENEGHSSRTVGVRYLIDTWLGEASDVHFQVLTADDAEAGLDETGFGPVETERAVPRRHSILESSGDEGALQLLLDKGTMPERIAVANRSRLSDAAWSYNPSRRRGFDFPPYSRGDSAVHITFAREDLEPGERRVVELYFSAPDSDFEAPEEAPDTVDPPEIPDVSRIEAPPLPHADPPAEPGLRPVRPPVISGPADEPDDDPETILTREEATAELTKQLERLREISDGERRAGEGELEEIRDTIERLRRLRDRL